MENDKTKTYNYIRGICLVLEHGPFGCNTLYNTMTELKRYFKQVSKVPLKFLYEKDKIQIFFYLHIVNDAKDAHGFYDENILYNVSDVVRNILTLHEKLKKLYSEDSKS